MNSTIPSKRSVLIINKAQFGYHVDSYKYCEYLRDRFDVTYLCFDSGKEKVVLPGVDVNYINWEGSFLQKGKTFIRACKAAMAGYDIVFCVYFQGSSLLTRQSGKQRMILDIRTGYVGEERLKKWCFNRLMRFESRFFSHVSIISDSLAQLLKIKRYSLLPLGSDVLSNTEKDFSSLKLIYIGTLTNRRINETVHACRLFVEQHGATITYDIFGDGNAEAVQELKNEVAQTPQVRYHGFKRHTEIQPYLDTCNVGVSFVPMTDYFDVQPPTKTFEYLHSGMICLGTDTAENRKIITTANGVLCRDTVASFQAALEDLQSRAAGFNSDKIRQTVAGSTWDQIVERYLIPQFD